MPATLLYPSNFDLQEIERDLVATLTEDDLIFKYFPIEASDAAKVMWEQKDNFTGLMQARGVNGNPGTVKLKGGKKFEMDPGRYAERFPIEEADIEQRRQLGSPNLPIRISDLVTEAQQFALTRRITRMKWILWTLASSGTFSVPNPVGGGIIHTDTFPIQTQNAAVAWGTFATATPIADMRAVKLKGRGTSSKYGPDAVGLANQTTINKMLANTNSADLGGKRIENGSTFNTLKDVNVVLAANDLPQLVVYDDFYIDDAGATQLFIPNDKVVFFGTRPNNARIGKFKVTRNASNDGASPGPFTFVVDSLSYGVPVPRTIEVVDGFNGGPTVEYPSAICLLNTLG